MTGLILMTDGVIEAQNEKKELFGFVRTTELMRQKKSAVEIADTPLPSAWKTTSPCCR